jgi:hypothetical protein
MSVLGGLRVRVMYLAHESCERYAAMVATALGDCIGVVVCMRCAATSAHPLPKVSLTCYGIACST